MESFVFLLFNLCLFKTMILFNYHLAYAVANIFLENKLLKFFLFYFSDIVFVKLSIRMCKKYLLARSLQRLCLCHPNDWSYEAYKWGMKPIACPVRLLLIFLHHSIIWQLFKNNVELLKSLAKACCYVWIGLLYLNLSVLLCCKFVWNSFV